MFVSARRRLEAPIATTRPRDAIVAPMFVSARRRLEAPLDHRLGSELLPVALGALALAGAGLAGGDALAQAPPPPEGSPPTAPAAAPTNLGPTAAPTAAPPNSPAAAPPSSPAAAPPPAPGPGAGAPFGPSPWGPPPGPMGYGPPPLWSAGDVAIAPQRRWYGWQNLLGIAGGQALTLGATAVAANGQSEEALAVALGGLSVVLFASPTIHWAHGHLGKGFGSLGLHVGGPVGVGLVSAAAGCAVECDDGIGPAVGLVVGLFVGHVGAIVIDVAVLANEDVTPEPATGRRAASGARRAPPRPAVVPTLSLRSGGATLGAAGAF